MSKKISKKKIIKEESDDEIDEILDETDEIIDDNSPFEKTDDFDE